MATATVAPKGDPRVAPPARPEGGRGWRGWRRWRVTDRFWLAVAGAVGVGFVLRLAIGLTDDAPASDETAYLNSGISLLDGQGFTRAGHPELHFPPFVPFVLGVAHKLIGDPHVASVVVTIVCGTAAIVPLALVARRVAGPRLGRRAGVAAAWIAAVLPGLATMPATRGTGSEAIYTLVVVSATWLALAAAEPTRPARARLALAAGAGALVGCAYLTRPEGLFIAVPLGIAVLWPAVAARREAGLRPVVATAALFALPVVLCVVPYASFLHTHTGEWGLTAKTRDASIEAWHAVATGDRLTRDSILYDLDETGLHFEDERSSLPSLARDDPSGYAAILRTNAGELVTTAVGWTLVPLPVTALAAWGAWQRRRQGATAVVLVVGALPVVTALVFFVQPRYLVLTVAALTVLAGVGLACVSARWRPWAAAAVLGMCLFASVDAFHGPAGWGSPSDFTDQKLAGEWLAENAEPGARVVTRSMVVDFYADRPTVALPYAELDEVLRFSRHYGARYLVADDAHIGRFRPQLTALLEDGEVEGLRLVHEVTAEGRTTRVYELDPVPSPPESDDEAPALGFMGDG
jgi:hypothetical protein